MISGRGTPRHQRQAQASGKSPLTKPDLCWENKWYSIGWGTPISYRLFTCTYKFAKYRNLPLLLKRSRLKENLRVDRQRC